MDKSLDEVFDFPCQFPIKAMGNANDTFEETVLSIITKHVPSLAEDAIKLKESKNGKFLSITVTITAKSKEQLDTIYQELTDSPEVLMAL